MRRGQKTVRRTFAWEVDRPFHINAGLESRRLGPLRASLLWVTFLQVDELSC